MHLVRALAADASLILGQEAYAEKIERTDRDAWLLEALKCLPLLASLFSESSIWSPLFLPAEVAGDRQNHTLANLLLRDDRLRQTTC